MRRATFFLCDELLVSLNSKFNIVGMYTGDLVIPSDLTILPQLVIVAEIETPIEKPFRSLSIQVQLPGEPVPRINDVTTSITHTMHYLPATEGRTTVRFKVPFLIQQPTLGSGPIEVKILDEEGEFSAGQQWVVTIAQAMEARDAQQATR
jgi:hypothetical protein